MRNMTRAFAMQAKGNGKTWIATDGEKAELFRLYRLGRLPQQVAVTDTGGTLAEFKFPAPKVSQVPADFMGGVKV